MTRLPSRTCAAINVSLAITSWALVYALVTHPLVGAGFVLSLALAVTGFWRVLGSINVEAE